LTPVALQYKAKEVAAGNKHTIITDEHGNVWCFGSNTRGQLGLQDVNQSVYSPKQNLDLHDIITISAGHSFTIAVDQRGEVFSFGQNKSGQLGLGDDQDRNTPTKIPSLKNIQAVSSGLHHVLALDSFGYVWSFGYNFAGQLGLGDNIDRPTPCLVSGLEHIVQLASGNHHNLVLDESHKAWSFGYNMHGQLGKF
jgi:alpha-tubulin suppressor-like RCC1 family protein